MKYTNMRSEQAPQLISALRKDPHPCYIQMLMRADGKILVARGAGNKLGKLSDRFIVVDTMHRGGTILGYPDSICLVAFDYETPDWCDRLADYLRGKGLNAEHKGNDVLVDGYKVAGFSATRFFGDNFFYYTFFVSMTVDLNDILLVCKKPMKKIPKGLGDYGITRQEILNALEVESEEE